MADPLRVLLHNDATTVMAQKLSAAYPHIKVEQCNTYDALPAMVAEFRPDVVYSVRFAGTPGFPRDALFRPGGPKWIANGGAGTDHFAHWDTAHTTVTNGAGVAADMMAEYVMGGFLHFTLDVPGFQSDQRQHLWQDRTVRPLKGATLLIIGLGHTGRAIAARAKAFGMRVIGTRARPCPMDNVDAVHPASDLAAVLARADFIAIATPLTPATRGLLGPAEFAAMRRGVILADVSRGGVINQTALLHALDTGQVAAAALDVFETEPLPNDSPFWHRDNVIVSPHCSSVYAGWEDASFDLFLSNLDRWLKGQELTNVVDPGRGY
jgi:phosphoglycerate dehydrogenase-like enzyme